MLSMLSLPQATQAGDASGAAPATSSAPAKPQAWKALNRAVRDQVRPLHSWGIPCTIWLPGLLC